MNNKYTAVNQETAKQLSAWATALQSQMKPSQEQMQEVLKALAPLSAKIASTQKTLEASAHILGSFRAPADFWKNVELPATSLARITEITTGYGSLIADLQEKYTSISLPLSTQAILTGLRSITADKVAYDDEALFVTEDGGTVAVLFEKAETAPEELEAMFSRLNTLEKHILACFLMVYFQLHAILFPEIMSVIGVIGTYQTIFNLLK